MQTIANAWLHGNQADRLAMLTQARERCIPVDVELLGTTALELDALAEQVGLVGVYVVGVDAAGLSTLIPGAVAPMLAKNYRRRPLRPLAAEPSSSV